MATAVAAIDSGVVIAGAGVAGAALALELGRRGFAVWMLERPPGTSANGIEALPPRAISAFAALDLLGALRRAGAVAGPGFGGGGDSRWVYVDRVRLATEVRAEACARGARLVAVDTLPPLTIDEDRGRSPHRTRKSHWLWSVRDLPPSTATAVDATGRAARWIGDIGRAAPRVAQLYAGPGAIYARPSRIATLTAGWAYVLHHPSGATAGVIADTARGNACRLSGTLAQELGIENPDAFRAVRRTPAHAQWALTPASAGLLAIGDAAFACEPIAGQGLRFALASASAAALVIAAELAGAESGESARSYYQELVASTRRRHLTHSAAAFQTTHDALGPPVLDPRGLLCLAAKIVEAPVGRGGRVIVERALRLGSGEIVRWAGGVDLLHVADLAESPQEIRSLVRDLRKLGLAPPVARRLLRWCVEKEILAPGAHS